MKRLSWRDLAGPADLKAQHSISGLPLPADYAASFLLFGMLGIVSKTKAAPAAAAPAVNAITNTIPTTRTNNTTASAVRPAIIDRRGDFTPPRRSSDNRVMSVSVARERH